jgi:hypothetical protein
VGVTASIPVTRHQSPKFATTMAPTYMAAATRIFPSRGSIPGWADPISGIAFIDMTYHEPINRAGHTAHSLLVHVPPDT